jgi:uncharacterized membrane protein YoaK (UPF0700 family)
MLDSRRNIALACALSGLAGYLDGIGYLHLGGLFVSFMSGNSTRLGVDIAKASWFAAAQTIGVIVTFVIGAAAGSLIALGRGGRRQTWLLLTESLLLIGAALAYTFGWPPVVAVAAIVFAMGLENSVFEVRGNAALGLTYVTGALVKVGQLLGAALTGGARWEWLPNLMLWAALVLGSTVGAFAYLHLSLSAVWFAAGAAVMLTAIVAVRDK